MMEPEAATSTESVPTPAKPAWYTLNPKHLRFSKFTWWLLALATPFILFACISIRPLWIYGWEHPLYCAGNFYPVKAADGRSFTGGEWARSREILVYGAPGISGQTIKNAGAGLQSLIQELGLAITVKIVPTTPEAEADIKAATVTNGTRVAFDLERYEALRLAHRQMQYAEMVVVRDPFVDPDWAFGVSYFNSGLAVLQEGHADHALGRHEGTHLIGYMKHDDMPWYVVGEAEGIVPSRRDTLMMLNPTPSDALSPRAYDALLAFWRGMGHRHETTYFQ